MESYPGGSTHFHQAVLISRDKDGVEVGVVTHGLEVLVAAAPGKVASAHAWLLQATWEAPWSWLPCSLPSQASPGLGKQLREGISVLSFPGGQMGKRLSAKCLQLPN